MLHKLRVVILTIFFINLLPPVFAEDIPIIVIAPSNKAQSKSTVGTSVVVFDKASIENSNDFFLGDVLGNKTTSFNYFQTGGHGSTSGIQLRGLPKRYSTVFIDGVKMSDPSTPDNSYYISNLVKDSIDRIEILKGSQSSL